MDMYIDLLVRDAVVVVEGVIRPASVAALENEHGAVSLVDSNTGHLAETRTGHNYIGLVDGDTGHLGRDTRDT